MQTRLGRTARMHGVLMHMKAQTKTYMWTSALKLQDSSAKGFKAFDECIALIKKIVLNCKFI